MKRFLLLSILAVIFLSCEKNPEKISTNLKGKWRLVEMLLDPGDGSGVYKSVDSKKMIEFQDYGIIASNGQLCDMSIESKTPSVGTYSLTDSTITTPACTDLPIRFSQKGSVLYVFYPCIEACSGKYIKQ